MMAPCRLGISRKRCKGGRGRVYTPIRHWKVEPFHGRQGFGNTLVRVLMVAFGCRNPGAGLPGQRLPCALFGRERPLQKPVRVMTRLDQISLREPKFSETRIQL